MWFSRAVFLLWYAHYFLGFVASPLLIVFWNHTSVTVIEALCRYQLLWQLLPPLLLLSRPHRTPFPGPPTGGEGWVFYMLQ